MKTNDELKRQFYSDTKGVIAGSFKYIDKALDNLINAIKD